MAQFAPSGEDSPPEICEVCGSSNIVEIRCKIVCQNCGTILKSCADLEDEAVAAVKS